MKSFEKLLNFLIVLAVMGIGGSYFYFKNRKQDAEISKDKIAHEVEVDKVVNKYMQQTARDKSLDQVKLDRAAFEANKKIMAERDAAKEQEEKKSAAVPQQIPTDEQMQAQAEKMGDNPNARTSQSHPNKSGELDIKNMSAQEKAEYKKQFIENAKNGGYDIELNDDMEITKATAIRKPSQQDDSVKASPSN